jgi:hypothetical protein
MANSKSKSKFNSKDDNEVSKSIGILIIILSVYLLLSWLGLVEKVSIIYSLLPSPIDHSLPWIIGILAFLGGEFYVNFKHVKEIFN